MALMLACLTGFIVSAAFGNGVNTDVTSSGTVWNTGVIMDYGSYRKGVWKLHINSASEGFVKQNTVESVDVTNLSEPLTYPLDAFENGKVHVRLQINGVEDVDSEISMQ